ncbi:MAG: PssE/Cps14G family polysaccharide biosynthesis glycosyltransferase [Sedimentisphaerales bacterium]|jgi:UDP-N-acetylglucosamine transferase subunit ALG13
MIFLTVGTLFPFDRLVRAIDAAAGDDLITDEIFAQIGESSYKPRNFESVPSLEKGLFDKYFTEASFIISHAGMGTIIMALSHNKPLLVMPRLKHYKEHVNDHQVATAKEFEKLGHILVAYDTVDLPEHIHQLKSFVPRERKANPGAVADRISCFLNSMRH